MKKIVLLICLCIPLFMQADLIGVGVRGGIAISRSGGDASTEDKELFGYGLSAGVFYSYKLIDSMDLFMLRPELSYMMKNATNVLGEDGGVGYGEFTLPLLLNIPLGMIDLPVFAGPHAGVKLHDSVESGYAEHLSTMTAGLTAGLGVELNLVAMEPGIEFRYVRDLTNTSDQKEADGVVWESFVFSVFVKF